jgi:hypothetical protein
VVKEQKIFWMDNESEGSQVQVAHTCNPEFQRAGGLRFEASLGKPFARPYLQNT